MPDTAPLSQLEAAQEVVYGHMKPTPELWWALLSERTGCDVWVKHENHTPIGAFKVRGGLNYLEKFAAENPDSPGIISATRGNHGQSLAYACARKNVPLTILVPYGNNPEKNAAMRALGANLVEHGDDFQEAREQAEVMGAGDGLHMIGPFHPWLMAGVGSYALEFLLAVPDLDTVYVPVGQGSGICGMVSARDALGHRTNIVGVVAENAAAYALSFEQGQNVSTISADTIADGLACRVPDDQALAIIMGGVERIETVSEAAIRRAMKVYFTDTHNIAEGAAAAPLAALLNETAKMAGKKVGLVNSGGNVDADLFKLVLEEEI